MAAVRFFVLHFVLVIFLLFSRFSFSLPETDALLKFKGSFTNADVLPNWTPNSSPCRDRWVGIICHKGTIAGLRLSNMGLSGKIDVEPLLRIPFIRIVNFANNSFTGPIPELNKLGALKAMLLSGNKFSGSIQKDYFSNLRSLKKVWLDGNMFNGAIPESLTKAYNLHELHLENNAFSGPIPAFKQPALSSFDVSNNKLEGEIPGSLVRFGASSFKGNENTCGKILDKDCTVPIQSIPSPPPPNDSSSSKPSHSASLATIAVASVATLAVVILVFVVFKVSKRKGGDVSVIEREDVSGDKVEIRVAEAAPASGPRVKTGSTKPGDPSTGPQKNVMGELVMLNDEKGVFGLPDLMKAGAEALGNGGLGSAYKAVMANGLTVVVKRLKEMNRMGRDGYDTEMKRLGRLRHKNILTPLAFHYRKEEKLVVSEHVPKGSLLYVLHGDKGIRHADLNWPKRFKIVQGIADGLGFLHSQYASYDLPHGNLKSSNVLLGEDYEPLLCDYAMHPLVNPIHAVQSLFCFRTPDYIHYQQVSHKTDVYCLGILILEILTGKFPTHYLNSGHGGTDVVNFVTTAVSEKREEEVIDPVIASDADSLNKILQLLHVGIACAVSNPENRPTVQEVIRKIEEMQV